MRIFLPMAFIAIATLACTKQPDASDGMSTQKAEGFVSQMEIRTLGWTPNGRADDHYAKYSGSGLVSGTAIVTWEDSLSEQTPPSEGFLYFKPSNQSRLQYQTLSDLIDVPLSERVLLALNLPTRPPEADDECGYEVTTTVILAEYFKFDREASSGLDVSDIVAVIEVSDPRAFKCASGQTKVSDTSSNAEQVSVKPSVRSESSEKNLDLTGTNLIISEATAGKFKSTEGQYFDEACGLTDYKTEVTDLNGDGQPEVFTAVEGMCMGGMAGVHMDMYIKGKNGDWKSQFGFSGFYDILKSKNKGYPDIRIGGPGHCSPVWRWNGEQYAIYKKCPD